MLQSWSLTALEQNLGHLRNHWGIEDKTFPWHCFYTNLTDEICVSHDLFSIQTMKNYLRISPHPFFPCRTCSCNVYRYNFRSFQSCWNMRGSALAFMLAPGSLSLSSTWVSPLPASMILKPNFRSFGQARRDKNTSHHGLRKPVFSSMTQGVGLGIGS